MFTWIVGNLATIVICFILIAVTVAIIIKLVRNKRKGVSSCGCGCTGCPMSDNENGHH